MRWKIILIIVACTSCTDEPLRETLSVRSGGMQCSERIIPSRGGAGRVGISLSSTGNVKSGVNLTLPTNGESSVEGPTQRCDNARQIAEETARIEQEIRRAELREALANAQLAEARAEAELQAINLKTKGLEGVDW